MYVQLPANEGDNLEDYAVVAQRSRRSMRCREVPRPVKNKRGNGLGSMKTVEGIKCVFGRAAARLT